MKLSDLKHGLPEKHYLSADRRHPSSPDYEGPENENVKGAVTVKFPIHGHPELKLEVDLDLEKQYDDEGAVVDAKIHGLEVKLVHVDGRKLSLADAKREYDAEGELDLDAIKDAVTDTIWSNKGGRQVYVGDL